MIDPDAFNAFEAATWEHRATGYDRFFGAITGRIVEPLLDAASVGSGTRVLDVATGPGYVAGRAAARGASVIGVDIAAAMVSMASQMHPEVEFRQADAHALPFEDGSFDAVIGNFVILHLGRPEVAANEFARVLAPGGSLALSAWDTADRARIFGVFLDAVVESGATRPAELPVGPDFFRFASDDAFDTLLRDAGLVDRRVETIDFTHAVSTAELWDGMLAGTVRTSALILGQPEGVQRRIRDAFDRNVAAYRSGDEYRLPVAVKLAVGRKPG
jgi:SAM-dependent methyltransferase